MKLSNQDIFHLLHQKSRYTTKLVNQPLKEHGLYTSQWSILFCLHEFGTMTQKEIWTYLNVEAPTVTRTVKRMEESGWIERTQGDDKRERIIVLTEEAKVKFSEIEASVETIERTLLQHFTEQEKEQLYELLRKIEI